MPTITEIAAGSAEFSVLVSTLSFVDTELPGSDLVATLNDASSDFTVFAPANSAFAQLATDLGYDGDANDTDAVTAFLTGAVPAETLRDVLLYHVAGESLTASEIGTAGEVTTLQGGIVTLDAPTLVDFEPDLIDASLVTTDVAADNGIVHIIDRVMLPMDLSGNDAPTITGIVEASGELDENGNDFDLLLAAVSAAGLGGALDDASADLTVFAPNDTAFLSLAQTLGFEGTDEAGALSFILRGLNLLSGGEPIELLTQVLTYHVAGESLQSSQVLAMDSIVTLQGGSITVDGTNLGDLDPELPDPSIIGLDIQAANGIVHLIDGVLLPADVLASDGNDDVDLLFGDDTNEVFNTGTDNDLIDAGGGNDVVRGGAGNDIVIGAAGNDRLLGETGNDLLRGGDGNDTLNGAEGADTIFGGDSDSDLGDWIYAGESSDLVDAGGGNDVVYGGGGADTISGGAGTDFLAGQDGDDVLAGNGLSDQIFGNAGNDFINGGFGFDRLNGGEGADRFYHLGISDHGTDWIQDYNADEGDVLVFGQSDASIDDFVIHMTHAGIVGGNPPGDEAIEEVFVDYNGQVIFALVDGAAQSSIIINIGGTEYDLLS
ncbi:fasciclin domain-containing protein [Ruegeria sp. WL0004]|uniref:Fasciclin domain-containing protein n=1 Tax=Ruegeria marisflavi TaxID=2984152 RepID=A0ABT2WW27_9RHOB|nr:fasciclin domain-containing protein [Ruegeria sp. WL0004]MCU9840104.1 fasciclin domain-containing protein [Ruegeria sp. WL0004]